jgi:hypothetical protein
MSEEKDKSWIWNLALIGTFFVSLWYCVKFSWQLLQMLCGYDAKKGEFSIGTAVAAWIGVAIFVGGFVWLALEASAQ